jgi:hypothetical protein
LRRGEAGKASILVLAVSDDECELSAHIARRAGPGTEPARSAGEA